ncbi:MAG: uroporphyrinogen decarboxylase family protein [bacterium]
MSEMTGKERMLAAYRCEEPDTIPVAPELWYLVPMLLTGRPFYEVMTPIATTPLWQVQLNAAKYFGAEAWIAASLGNSPKSPEKTTEIKDADDGGKDVRITYHTSKGNLIERYHCPPADACWVLERPVKDLFRDFEAYEEVIFVDPWTRDTSEIDEATEATRTQGIMEGIVGVQFIDFLSEAREGGLIQVVYDLEDHPEFFEHLHERYIKYIEEKTRAIIERTNVDAVFIGCDKSCLSTISPNMWRRWDLPVIRRVAEVAHEYGAILHLHEHGICSAILRDIADAGVDVVCPLERAPGGDVNLGDAKRLYGDKMALKGNVHTIETLLRGTPGDVEKEVKRCIRQAGPGGGYILGTGDQVARDTPFENIRAMIEAGRKYGKYPLKIEELEDER